MYIAAVPVFMQTALSQENHPVTRSFHDFRHTEVAAAARMMKNTLYEDPAKVEQQRKFDVRYYGIDISVDPDSRTISGSVVMRAESADMLLDNVILDLQGDLTVTGVSGNYVEHRHEMDENTLLIDLDRTYATGEQFELIVSYAGSPRQEGFASFSWAQQLDGSMLISTLSEPYYARNWWPCKDIPEDKADSVSMRITVPEGFTAVSNGVLCSVTDNADGTKTFHWHEKYPISTYLVSLAAAHYEYSVEYFRYTETDSMPVEYYITPYNVENAFSLTSGLPETKQMLSVFSELFGQYPFADEKYAQVEFSWGGGMEHQTATSLGIRYGGPSRFLVAHELAHQWWGDLITCRNWNHLWLNEGFATYSEGLYLEALYGYAMLKDYMQSIDMMRYSGKEFSGRVYRDDLENVYTLFDLTVYDKAAWVLHMLRGVVGDDTFFEILKAYAANQDTRYGTAVTDDFRAVCERVYGSGLDWFFDQWIYGYGRPFYEYSWTYEAAVDSFQVTLDLKQVQGTGNEEVFVMPVDVFFHGQDRSEVITVMNDSGHQQYTFTVGVMPMAITLDDESRILKRTRLVSSSEDETVPPRRISLCQNYPNPFNSSTVIRYGITSTEHVTITVYTIGGSEVARLDAGLKIAGEHEAVWNGRNSLGRTVASGVYLYRIQAGSFAETRKMLLIR